MRSRTPQIAIDLIKPFEAFTADWYLCPAEKWTIGWGLVENTISGINRETTPGPIDVAFADELLHASLDEIFYPSVEKALPRAHVFKRAAAASLVYNIGVRAFERSTLHKAMLRNDLNGIQREWPRWRLAGGRVQPGLVRRREVELVLYNEGWERAKRSMRAHRIIEMDRLDVQPAAEVISYEELKKRAREQLSRELGDG